MIFYPLKNYIATAQGKICIFKLILLSFVIPRCQNGLDWPHNATPRGKTVDR